MSQERSMLNNSREEAFVAEQGPRNCRMNRCIDEVQKEFVKSKDELEESSMIVSPFVPEIHDKPISRKYWLPTLEAYDDSSDPTEHVVAFRVQMVLYKTSNALIYRAFPTTLRGPAWMCYNTDDYYDLKNQIEGLVYRGHLDRYIRKSCEPSPYPKGPVEKQIDVIVSGLTSGGESSLACKAYARAAVEKTLRHERDPEITYRSGEGEYPDHDNASVISTHIANARVKRIMVDTGSSTDILYFDAFQKFGLSDWDLVPMTSTLIRFTRDSISLLGITTLLVTVREEPRSKTLIVLFMMVKLPSTYNAILDLPTLNKLRVIVSTYHLMMKFLTSARVGEARSDP
ncbi:hypothetical protein GW17_00009044 [Ensete ventricosum]|nr:hypothetical protein GW17_00009044 [Ensete ventricosum]